MNVNYVMYSFRAATGCMCNVARKYTDKDRQIYLE